MLSGRPSGAEEILGYKYDLIVYSNLAPRRQVWKTYDDGIISVIVEICSTWVFKIQELVLYCTGNERSTQIVQTQFYLCDLSAVAVTSWK